MPQEYRSEATEGKNLRQESAPPANEPEGRGGP
jgi:hypothetical protein